MKDIRITFWRGSISPFLFQTTVGVGLPVASHSKVNFFPFARILSVPSEVIFGATDKESQTLTRTSKNSRLKKQNNNFASVVLLYYFSA